LLLYPERSQKTCNDHIYLHSTMLLLYRDVVVLSDEIIKEFTFHYASTLSFPGIYFQNPPHYLHSTMLLLYPGDDLIDRIDHKFTFHYASTLSKTYYIKIPMN